MDLTQYPTLAPPDGVSSNSLNPVSQAKPIKVVTTICMFLMSLSFAMRMYSRLWIKRTFKIDDIACLLAVAGTVAYTAVFWSVLSVVGKHAWDVAVSEYTSDFFRALIIGLHIGYNPVIFFTKLSLLFFYLRAFASSHKTRILVYIGIASISVVYTGTVIGYGILCIPKSGSSWFATVLSSKCAIQSIKLAYATGSFGVISDFYLLYVPISVVLRLQMPQEKKIAVCAIFMTGFLACISSILGLYFRFRTAKSQNISWNLGRMTMIIVVELSVGIICSCLPVTTPIFRKHSLRLSPFVKGMSAKLSFRNTFHRRRSPSAKNYHLKTSILRSAFGDGKFLNVEDLALNTSSSRGEETGLARKDGSKHLGV